MVIDLLYFARAIPTVPVQRRMQLAPLIAARAASTDKPRWTAVFAKAYALVAAEHPVLRRAYVKLPWPRLYEYPTSTATIMFEREHEGEPSLFSYLLRDPTRLSLKALSERLAGIADTPVDEVKDFRRNLTISSLPRPLRRLIWWLGLNIARQRGNYFGTFGISVYSALQAESLHPLAPVTTVLNYGVFMPDGSVNVRIIYDHRVMDGATVARVLARLEEVLAGPILEEVRGSAQSRAGASFKPFEQQDT
jgi:hypothetical protein